MWYWFKIFINMYKIKFLEEAKKDIKKLDKAIQNQVLKKLQKISDNPEIWNNLTWELVWYKKVYVNNKKIRIVYKIIDEKIEILIIAIWKRETKKVYKESFKRIKWII